MAAEKRDGRGCVVVTSSCSSLHLCTNIDLMSYAASKAATDHLVGMLAAKVGRFGIRVNGINPGCMIPLLSLSIFLFLTAPVSPLYLVSLFRGHIQLSLLT